MYKRYKRIYNIIAKGFAKCITIILSWLVFNIKLESFRIVYIVIT